MNGGIYRLAVVCVLALAGCQSMPEAADFESSRARGPQDRSVEVLVDDRIESLALAERIRQATAEALSRCGFESSSPDAGLLVLVTVGQLPETTSPSRPGPRPSLLAALSREGMSQAADHNRRPSSIFETPSVQGTRVGLLWSAIERRHLQDPGRPPGEWPRIWRAFASLPASDQKWSIAGPPLVESLRKSVAESWMP
jgi:hypothetical protein